MGDCKNTSSMLASSSVEHLRKLASWFGERARCPERIFRGSIRTMLPGSTFEKLSRRDVCITKRRNRSENRTKREALGGHRGSTVFVLVRRDWLREILGIS